MNALYRSIGISKQAVHKYLDRKCRSRSEELQLLLLIYQIRKDHPTMCCRDMYYMLQPSYMGRDAFERFCREEGLMSTLPKNYRRTTDSTGVVRFENKIENLKVTCLNQVWQSDITYYELNGMFYYLTFIIDSFSRRVIGHQVSKRLTTEYTTLPSLQKAIKTRKGYALEGLIFHSDGGGQYYDKDFLKLTGQHKMVNSMCEFAWENGKAERINGIIKNNYLKHRRITTYEELVKEVDRSVLLYNQEKPHIKLQRKSPIEFEKYYICGEQKTDGEKSATEYKPQHKGYYSPSGCEQKTSSSNIALEYINILRE
jgi:putative transposase